MNTNMLHNILNLIGVLVGALISFDWTSLGFSASTAAAVGGGVLLLQSGIKLAINVLRDGLTGLVKDQPPVK